RQRFAWNRSCSNLIFKAQVLHDLPAHTDGRKFFPCPWIHPHCNPDKSTWPKRIVQFKFFRWVVSIRPRPFISAQKCALQLLDSIKAPKAVAVVNKSAFMVVKNVLTDDLQAGRIIELLLRKPLISRAEAFPFMKQAFYG